MTAGLMLAGFLFGGVAGAVLMFLLGFLSDGWRTLLVPEILLFGAAFGAVFGMLLGPLGAWMLMRDVPLGRAVGGTTLGTVLGGAAALAWNAPDLLFYAPVAGFALAAVALRVHARRRQLRGARSNAQVSG
ncbi:MAG TPA: hypothetical protein VIB55_14155 [Longimicrobium sp.]